MNYISKTKQIYLRTQTDPVSERSADPSSKIDQYIHRDRREQIVIIEKKLIDHRLINDKKI
jgi:hypothetical protein